MAIVAIVAAKWQLCSRAVYISQLPVPSWFYVLKTFCLSATSYYILYCTLLKIKPLFWFVTLYKASSVLVRLVVVLQRSLSCCQRHQRHISPLKFLHGFISITVGGSKRSKWSHVSQTIKGCSSICHIQSFIWIWDSSGLLCHMKGYSCSFDRCPNEWAHPSVNPPPACVRVICINQSMWLDIISYPDVFSVHLLFHIFPVTLFSSTNESLGERKESSDEPQQHHMTLYRPFIFGLVPFICDTWGVSSQNHVISHNNGYLTS